MADIVQQGAGQSVFYRWTNPLSLYGPVYKRQSGYHPDIANCDNGQTCSDACGDSFVACAANTDLALFCYDPAAGQICCNTGDGHACDAGYYCAQDPLAGSTEQTWCCEQQFNLAECASMYQLSTLVPPVPSTTRPVPVVLSSSSSTSLAATSSSVATTRSSSVPTTTRGNSTSSNATTTASTSRPAVVTARAPSRKIPLGTVLLLGMLVALRA